MSYATKINLTTDPYSPPQPFYPGFRLPQSTPGNQLQQAGITLPSQRPRNVADAQITRVPESKTSKGPWRTIIATAAVLLAIALIVVVVILAVKLSEKSDNDSQAASVVDSTSTTAAPSTTSTLRASITLLDRNYSPDLADPKSALFAATSHVFCQQIESVLSNSTAYRNGGCVVNAFRRGSVLVEYAVNFQVRVDENENDKRKQIAMVIAEGVTESKMNSRIGSGYFTDSNGNKVDNCVGTNNCTSYQNSACFTTLESYVCYCLPGYEQTAPNTDCTPKGNPPTDSTTLLPLPSSTTSTTPLNGTTSTYTPPGGPTSSTTSPAGGQRTTSTSTSLPPSGSTSTTTSPVGGTTTTTAPQGGAIIETTSPPGGTTPPSTTPAPAPFSLGSTSTTTRPMNGPITTSTTQERTSNRTTLPPGVSTTTTTSASLVSSILPGGTTSRATTTTTTTTTTATIRPTPTVSGRTPVTPNYWTTSPFLIQFRLAGSGSNATTGRLEVYYNGVWGTVCDDYFNDMSASVACNSLGFGFGGTMLYNQYGPGTGQIWLDNVQCAGYESSIAECYHNAWGSHDCSHSEDVSISCVSTASACGRQFTCSSGQCVHYMYRCNGFADCDDGSDEVNCYCDPRYYFQCTSGSCVSRCYVCDGSYQCSDRSDERECPCSSGQFQCRNGQCVVQAARCNGLIECTDRSDEANCSCNATQFRCSISQTQCIPLCKLCDGIVDCNDLTDEANCTCGNENSFRCNNGQCISACKACNSRYDCTDGSDELNCTYCHAGDFHCVGYADRCVRSCARCDGSYDCPDYSDEFNCTCTDKQFRCRNGQCISSSHRCDGTYNCYDYSDETECPCSSTQYRCNNTGQCIPLRWYCDYGCDCYDCSDEPTNCHQLCRHGLLKCNSSNTCYDPYYQCDGWCYCGDCSDEMHCNCSADQYKCENADRCISVYSYCDSVCHCSDCSDEPANCTKMCPQGQFTCEWYNYNVTVCIGSYYVCNGWCECKDCSDEKQCNCTSDQFSCEADDRCITLSSYCDGSCDCSDCVDEPANCSTVSLCPSNQFFCRSSYNPANDYCMSYAYVCDGSCNCRNCSDETDCANKCSYGQPQCDNGWCLLTRTQCNYYGSCTAGRFWCDGYADCPDRSDEKYCSNWMSTMTTTRSPSLTSASPFALVKNCTGSTAYQCANGWCISIKSPCTAPWCQWNFHCDGYIDCPDGSDEANCTSISSSLCRPGEFMCDDQTKCILRTKWCNGVNDCPDRSDERNCPCASSYQIKCGSGECIYYWYRCDGYANCADASDEMNCTCTSSQFRCANGQCAYVSSQCAGYSYCQDNSDQANCTCGHNQFQCANYACISACQVCDGVSNCRDNSDELNCTCDATSKFRCKSGQCIDTCKRCDGNIDCADWSDETNCSCPFNEFRCSSGLCIPACQVCDGYSQCSDYSDEVNCTNINNCSYYQFRCASDGRCISSYRRCDGYCDCAFCTDEVGCSTPPAYYGSSTQRYTTTPYTTSSYTYSYSTAPGNITCKPNQFFCIYGGYCTYSSWVCDGGCDCPGCTDEVNCSCSSSEFQCNTTGQCVSQYYRCDSYCSCSDCSDEWNCDCRNDGLPCKNGRCYYQSERCDGVNNCGDYTDETNCSCSSYYQFQCKMGLCLDYTVWCNGTTECPDGSDEPPNCLFMCSSQQFTCNNSRCIDRYRVCNGFNDCGDFSDEINCTCAAYSYDSYKCAMGLCVWESTWCDGYKDCPDGSDELPNCNTTCPGGITNRRQCTTTGLCLRASQICDGNQDCPDDSDEINCTCQYYQYPCINGRCIYRDWLCDGVKDCPLGDDESPTLCNRCNTSTEFTCVRNYTCIPAAQECDGVTQCTDTSDESHCLSLNETVSGSTDKLLVVKYHGLSGYYVCADQWTSQMSDRVCQQLGHNSSAVSTSSVNISSFNVTRWLAVQNFSGNILTSLQLSSCPSRAAVIVECEQKVCGRRAINIDVNPYIIGGNYAARGAWPWQVMLKFDGDFLCGGSVLSDRWILTAAHCTLEGSASRYQVRLGAILADDPDPDAVYASVSDIYTYPWYDSGAYNNDVGLLRLSRPINYTETIRPICLPTRNVNMNQFKVCVDTGFGRIDNGDLPSRLLQVKLNIVPTSICQAAFYDIQILNETMICVGSIPAYHQGICFGDSGGPFACKDQQDVWTVIGINSFTSDYGCSQSAVARVSAFVDWIQQTMASNP